MVRAYPVLTGTEIPRESRKSESELDLSHTLLRRGMLSTGITAELLTSLLRERPLGRLRRGEGEASSTKKRESN